MSSWEGDNVIRLRTPPRTSEGRQEIDGLLDHFFRHQYGRVLATLTRILGRDNLDLAEAAVQEAMLRALRVWPVQGIPRDPPAWLLRTSRNYAVDVCRRRARFREREETVAAALNREESRDEPHFQGELTDDQLCMMFMCCHPILKRRVRVALTLKAVCGFSTAEIARAFFASESTIAQRIETI